MSWHRAIILLIAVLLAACSDHSNDAESREVPTGTATQSPTPGSAREATDEPQNPFEVLNALGPAYASANLDNGRRIWGRCSNCHSLDGSRPPLPGPDLQNILNARIGTQPGFEYSTALQEANFIWTAERLDAWLTSPDSFLEGNAMSFSGLSEPSDRRDLIACIAVGQTCLEGRR